MGHIEELRYLVVITRYKSMVDELGWEWIMHVPGDQNAY